MHNFPRKVVGFGPLSRVLPARFVLRLQQTVGNQAVVCLMAQSHSQTGVLGQNAEPLKKKERSAGWLAALAAAWRRLLHKPASK